MKTHFCHIERGHEGDPMTYYSNTACGLSDCESDMSDNKEDVTCKNCNKSLNRKSKRVVKSKSVQQSNDIF